MSFNLIEWKTYTYWNLKWEQLRKINQFLGLEVENINDSADESEEDTGKPTA